jgi:hypothetical protein
MALLKPVQVVLIANPVALKDFFDQVQKFFFTMANEPSIKFQNLRENEPPQVYIKHRRIGLHHPLDGVTNPEYKLLRFIQLTNFLQEKKALAFNRDRCCHLALCLRLILFHWH